MKQLFCVCALALATLFTAHTSFGQGLSVNSTGAAADTSAIFDASSTSKGMLAPRMTAAQKTAIISPATGLMIFQTDGTAGFYYYTGSAWMPVGSTVTTLTIGASFGGGKVAYVLQAGDPGYDPLVQHGLIAATSDQSTGIAWDAVGYGFLGATGYLLGTGRNNTEIAYQIIYSGTAALVCRSYAGGGFADWYLPSKDELNKLYINKIVIGGFASADYWSSSEYFTSSAWAQNFNSGFQLNGFKNGAFYVRAVRAF